MAKNYIILDAGHAKVTPGKRSPDSSLLEWEFNNDMQYRIKKRPPRRIFRQRRNLKQD